MQRREIATLRLSEQQLGELINEAKRKSPVEACALLFGRIEGNSALVTDVVLADNIYDSTVSFKIDPIFLYKALQKYEQDGKELVAIFHSHPAKAYPSHADIEGMQYYPVVWLIASLYDFSIAAFQLLDNKIYEVKLVIETKLENSSHENKQV